MSTADVTCLSTLSVYIPKDSARHPRCLKYVDRWKAIEFRRYSLYVGPVVLSVVLKGTFLVLNVATCVLIQL